jgi:hypothetical protein
VKTKNLGDYFKIIAVGQGNALGFSSSRSVCAMALASRKSRIRLSFALANETGQMLALLTRSLGKGSLKADPLRMGLSMRYGELAQARPVPLAALRSARVLGGFRPSLLKWSGGNCRKLDCAGELISTAANDDEAIGGRGPAGMISGGSAKCLMTGQGFASPRYRRVLFVLIRQGDSLDGRNAIALVSARRLIQFYWRRRGR